MPAQGNTLWTRAALWTLLEQLFSIVFQVATFIILARLLGPEAYGLFATVIVAFLLFRAILDAGVQMALIRLPSVSDDLMQSSFWGMLALTVTFCGIVTVSAPFLAGAFDLPKLDLVLWSLMPMALLYPALTIVTTILRRELRFRSLAARLFFANLAASLLSIAAALGGFGVFSLVIREVTTVALSVAVSFGIVKWRPRLHFRLADFAGHLSFFAYSAANRVFEILGARAALPIIAAGLGATAAGHFSAATRLSDLAFAFSRFTTSRIGLQAFSRGDPSDEDMRRMYATAVTVLASLSFPVFVGISLVSTQIITLAFDDAWLPVGDVLAVLSLSFLPQSLVVLNRSVLFARGWSRWSMMEALLTTLLSIGALFLAMPMGLIALAWVAVGRGVLRFIITLVGVRMAVGVDPMATARALVQPGLTVAAMAIAVFALRQAGWLGQESMIDFALTIIVGATVYVSFGMVLMRQALMGLARQVGSVMRIKSTSSAR